MTWSYSGNPSATPLDLARFLIGDTDTNDQLLSDDEINFMISRKGSADGAAPFLASNIMAKLARQIEYYLGPERVFAQQRFANYKELVQELRKNWIGSNAAPLWEGSNHGGRGDLFSIGMTDFNGGGAPDGLDD